MATACYSITGGDYQKGGTASGRLKELFKRVGIEPLDIRRAVIAAYEAEMNVVIHAYHGELCVTLNDGQIAVEVADEGPGIPDIELAMKEGFSTAPAAARELGFGAGMGLPNIKRNTDSLVIESTAGRGTRLRFTVVTGSYHQAAGARNSLLLRSGRCTGCLRCLRACPTSALRVHDGEIQVLDHLCIDCTSCISACPPGALTADVPDSLPAIEGGAVLVVPPAFLAQFGRKVSPEMVVAALRRTGFGEVLTTAASEIALRNAVCEFAGRDTVALPVVSPVCPAVVNLIELRFPSLIPSVAPFRSPVEALAPRPAGRQAVFVVPCPCQRTALGSSAEGPAHALVTPGVLREAILPLATEKGSGSAPAARTAADADRPPNGVLQVYGMFHVMVVLNRLEDGFLGDFRVVEPYACEQGCFGSPLMSEDPFVARGRWRRSQVEWEEPAEAVPRSAPLCAREGIRLDANIARAIEKLAQIDELAQTLAATDCGRCGAPTCIAFAEDVVLGRAKRTACPHLSSTREDRT